MIIIYSGFETGEININHVIYLLKFLEFLCPCHQRAGTYSVIHSVCLSVILHCLMIISATVAHFQLKFDIWMYIQTDVYNRVMPLELWTISDKHFLVIFSTSSTFAQIQIISIFGCISWIYRLSLIWVVVSWYLMELCLMLWEEWETLSFCFVTFEGMI